MSYTTLQMPGMNITNTYSAKCIVSVRQISSNYDERIDMLEWIRMFDHSPRF